MHIPFVDLKKQYESIKEEIDPAMSRVIDQTAFIGGEQVITFEQRFAGMLGVRHCIGVGNGTDALYIAYKMLGIGPGDEVITSSLSWIATSEAITQTGARPVFVDIDGYHSLDTGKIEKKITGKTKAIVPVHLYGQPADMDRIVALARKYNLFLVEDAAQAHFAKYRDHYCGTIGNCGIFSFYPGKNLGAYGDAGAIVTNDDDLAERCRMYANHGALKKHFHFMEGINSRLDGIQAAVLNVKLKYIHDWNAERQRVASYYMHQLAGLAEYVRLPEIRENTGHVFHIFAVRVSKRDLLIEFLKKSGIETAIHYPTPLPFMPAYNYLNYTRKDFPEVARAQNELLSLPVYPELDETLADYIVAAIREFYKT